MKLLKNLNEICALASLYHISVIVIMIFNLEEKLNFSFYEVFGIDFFALFFTNFLINIIVLVLSFIKLSKLSKDIFLKISIIINIIFVVSFIGYCVYLLYYLPAFYKN